MIIFEESGTRLTIESIRKLEKQYTINLPQDFIDYYLVHNGGYVKWSKEEDNIKYENIFIHNNKKSFCYAGFFMLEDILDDWKDEIYDVPDEFNPNQLLVFGYGHPGLYGISLREHDYGEVIFYITETSSKCYARWNTFTSFVNSFISETQERTMFFNNSNYYDN